MVVKAEAGPNIYIAERWRLQREISLFICTGGVQVWYREEHTSIYWGSSRLPNRHVELKWAYQVRSLVFAVKKASPESDVVRGSNCYNHKREPLPHLGSLGTSNGFILHLHEIFSLILEISLIPQF